MKWVGASGLLSVVFGTVMVFAILHVVEKFSLALGSGVQCFIGHHASSSLKLLVQRPELI